MMRVIEFGKNINSVPIVSAVIPCYNIASRMSRFLVSLLNQTYTNLDLIFVNDGSTDSTEDCIYEYIPKYVDKGMRVRYIYQENKGLGGAINTGLKYVEGEYLIWPDPDDWLSKDSVEKKLLVLLKNENVGVVTSNAYFYHEHDLDTPFTKERIVVDDVVKNPYQFEHMLHYNSTFCSGCHMIRVSMLKKANPQMDIFEAKRGQNFQMLLPMYYFFPRYYLDECLYNYVVYEKSMSRGDDTLDKSVVRADVLLEILYQTLDRIDMPADIRDKYKYKVKQDDIIKRFHLGLQFGDRAYALRMFIKIEDKNEVSLKHKLLIKSSVLLKINLFRKKLRSIKA